MNECKKCECTGERETAVLKSGVFIVCADCGKRLEKVDDRIVIEKVVVPEAFEKAAPGVDEEG